MCINMFYFIVIESHSGYYVMCTIMWWIKVLPNKTCTYHSSLLFLFIQYGPGQTEKTDKPKSEEKSIESGKTKAWQWQSDLYKSWLNLKKLQSQHCCSVVFPNREELSTFSKEPTTLNTEIKFTIFAPSLFALRHA